MGQTSIITVLDGNFTSALTDSKPVAPPIDPWIGASTIRILWTLDLFRTLGMFQCSKIAQVSRIDRFLGSFPQLGIILFNFERKFVRLEIPHSVVI